MTNRETLEYILNHYDLPTEVRQRTEAMLIAIENHKNQQVTNKQQKNSEIRVALVNYINSKKNQKFTVTDLIKHCDVVKGKSHQYVTSILRAAVSAGLIEKKVENYKTYFLPGRKN